MQRLMIRIYSKPRLYLLGAIHEFVHGSGSGNNHDFYAAVCDISATITASDCHHNHRSNAMVCNYFQGKGFLIKVEHDPHCK